ncbi:hypothetical protein C5167_049100 [Papaver somniferum]|uniref:Beta-ketoacyl synthase C-terminal domain-containing protein n=1 Tax=Papaver somniferum TaxID=3469 RepID=A0A4Y7KN71_PAPSO|nr:hypothetical protein C5167_049100 [Papaver somniferum]
MVFFTQDTIPSLDILSLRVTYINAHATSTPAGDLAKVNAIKKSIIGHWFGQLVDYKPQLYSKGKRVERTTEKAISNIHETTRFPIPLVVLWPHA